MSDINIRAAINDVLIEIIEGGVREFEPTFSPLYGFRYRELAKIARRHRVLTEDLVKALLKKGIIVPELYGRYVKCPDCDSFTLLTSFICPKCGSSDIDKVQLLSHVACGYIGISDEFKKGEEALNCPKCGRPLEAEGRDYITIGQLYECHSCGSRFDTPLTRFKCIGCGSEFGASEADYAKVYRYKVKMEAVLEAEKNLLKEAVKVGLAAEGLKVSENVVEFGLSGLSHHFDLSAEGSDGKVTIDFIHDSPEGSSKLIAAMGRQVDLPHIKSVIVVPENMAKELKTSIAGSNTKLVTYSEIKEAADKVKKAVLELLRRKVQEKETAQAEEEV